MSTYSKAYRVLLYDYSVDRVATYVHILSNNAPHSPASACPREQHSQITHGVWRSTVVASTQAHARALCSSGSELRVELESTEASLRDRLLPVDKSSQ